MGNMINESKAIIPDIKYKEKASFNRTIESSNGILSLDEYLIDNTQYIRFIDFKEIYSECGFSFPVIMTNEGDAINTSLIDNPDDMMYFIKVEIIIKTMA